MSEGEKALEKEKSKQPSLTTTEKPKEVDK